MILMANAMMGAAGYQAAGGGDGSAIGATVTDTLALVNSESMPSYTWSAASIGDETGNREIYIVRSSGRASPANIPGESCTVGGVSCAPVLLSFAYTDSSPYLEVSIFKAVGVNGSVADIVFNFGAWRRVYGPCVSVIAVDGPTVVDDTSEDFGVNPLGLSLRVSDGGIVLAGAMKNNTTGGFSWIGVDPDENYMSSTLFGGHYNSVAHRFSLTADAAHVVTAGYDSSVNNIASGAALSLKRP